ncbi:MULTISPECIES: ribonuclease I [unclassified Duganella]|uniref:ribonuclease T2 family protein n=1 Tax=unclassified Duganella TaxID=2636909 RepID=UPI000888355C|nr:MULTISPECIES: ribonuclease I [unclassified Duganella]SDF59177.1 ribonuclease T2 [Duganella sp. OV458]SDI69455.1 ribonuclease T2 [Duganella sp. OV510]
MRHYIAAALLTFIVVGASASESASGSFVAGKSCEAYSSFAKRSNPGDIKISAGTSYTVREINKTDFDWVRIEVPGAEPKLRWVQRECGKPELEEREERTAARGNGEVCSLPNQQDSYVLAITWQPGFCEHVSYKGKKPECDAMNGGTLAAKNLSLHGLWPNKKECGTNYGSCSGQPFALSKDTIEKVAPWMPNFYYERTFGAYEWNKHGKCQSLPPDDYFIKAVSAVRVVNESEVGKIVLGSTGKSFRVNDFFERVKARYGDKVANTITLVCTQRKYLQEIRVSLALDFATDRDLPQMVANAKPAASRTANCADEIYVEAAGR